MTEPAITPEPESPPTGSRPTNTPHPRDHRPASRASPNWALLGHVERALLVQIVQEMAGHPSHRGAAGDLRPRRERGRRGISAMGSRWSSRWRAHNNPSYIEPQPGRGNRRGRPSCATCSPWARAPSRHERAEFRRSGPPRNRGPGAWRGRGDRGLRQRLRRAHHGRRDALSPRLQWQLPRQRLRRRHRASRQDLLPRGPPAWGGLWSISGAKTGATAWAAPPWPPPNSTTRSSRSGPPCRVGDRFTEKRLMEACLELMETGAVISIQDMGAAGLTCSAVEMGDKGRLGHQAWTLDPVPWREAAMTAYEIGLPLRVARTDAHGPEPRERGCRRAIFEKWEPRFRHQSRKPSRGPLPHHPMATRPWPILCPPVRNSPPKAARITTAQDRDAPLRPRWKPVPEIDATTFAARADSPRPTTDSPRM